MTYAEFMKGLKEYYGPYQPAEKEGMVALYVRDEFIESELAGLLDHLLRNYIGEYKLTPNIGIIERAKKEINEVHKTIGKRRGSQTFKIVDQRDENSMQKVGDLAHKLVENIRNLNNMGDQTDE